MCNKWNNLKPEEMPYEKCMTLGAESLTDAELLAILLRTGTKNHTVLEVAEKLCDKVAIIKNGSLVTAGRMEDVKGDESLEAVFLELEDDNV